MEIENRESTQKRNPGSFLEAMESLALEKLAGPDGTSFRPLSDLPDSPGITVKRGEFRKELMGLFVEYFCKENPVRLKSLMEALEKGLILNVLERVQGNQKEAARMLGIKYTTLNQKVKRYGIRFQRGVRILES